MKVPFITWPSFFKKQIFNCFSLQSAWLFSSVKLILLDLLISEFCWSFSLWAIPWYLSLVTFPYQCNFRKAFPLLRLKHHIRTRSGFQSPVKKTLLWEREKNWKNKIYLFLILTYKYWVYFFKHGSTAGKECWWHRKVCVEMHHLLEKHCLVLDMLLCHVIFSFLL